MIAEVIAEPTRLLQIVFAASHHLFNRNDINIDLLRVVRFAKGLYNAANSEAAANVDRAEVTKSLSTKGNSFGGHQLRLTPSVRMVLAAKLLRC